MQKKVHFPTSGNELFSKILKNQKIYIIINLLEIDNFFLNNNFPAFLALCPPLLAWGGAFARNLAGKFKF